MLALGQLLALSDEHLEAAGQHPAGLGRVDDVIDIATLGRLVGVGVPFGVLLDQLGTSCLRVGGLQQVAAVDDLDRTGCAHDRQLG